ncbi:MAG: amidohydrolase [Gemmatimonadaceae bacterium]
MTLPLLLLTLALSGRAGDSLYARAEARIRAAESRLIDFRRDLHQHPETSGNEKRTADRVATRLRELGLEVRTGVGGHGVVAFIRGAKPGPLIAYRADMDAVYSDASDAVAFRSLTSGVRHICGHDLHTTIALAIAEGLAAERKEMAGTVMLIFQPAEERADGAKAMLADGLFAREKPVAIYALHTGPLEVGTMGTKAGLLMYGRDMVRATITGGGDLQTIADRAAALISATSTLAPEAAMTPGVVIPDGSLFAGAGSRAAANGAREVVGTLSSGSRSALDAARERIVAGLEGLRGHGVDVRVIYERRMIAGVNNDSTLVYRANGVISVALGAGSVLPISPAPLAFSEDFGSMQDQAPGVMWFLGVANAAKGIRGMPHAPDYDADEKAIVVGARAMTAVLLDRLAH